jgi:hypothetical protein
MPIILAALVGGGILLFFIGLASSSPIDPVQARLTQLGSFQAKNLEELELQQPFSERTMRPLIARLSRMGGKLGSASSTTRSAATSPRSSIRSRSRSASGSASRARSGP